ncbi:YbfB/YjiJ family MFS transporter [Roseibium hamelinense]|uniref:YbfB/YjiJ family MFS transporter n=1 Tax=Roseibium hamelinense TaxID=150831 RepID=UPI001AD8DBD1|nr:YbfB/YjiJ family MFS transporter [Roseibium hamelinense]
MPLAFGGFIALAAAMGIGRFVYTPILPAMAAGIPLPPTEAGLIASANFLGYLTGALTASAGLFARHPRWWFLTGMAISALTSGAMGLTPAFGVLAALRFVSGLASAFVLVFASTVVLERLQAAGRPGLSALHFGGVGAGIAFSAMLIASLEAGSASWPQLWFASALATLVFLAVALVLVPAEPAADRPAMDGPAAQTHPDTAQKPPAAQATPPLWTAPLVRLVLAYGLFGFGYVITATFVSVIAAEDPAMAPVQHLVWLVVGLAAAPSIYLWNAVSSRLGSASAFALACLAEAAGVTLTVAGFGPFWLMFGAALLGGTFMGITALGLTQARSLSPAHASRLLALMTASFGLGQMIGPFVAGTLREATGSYAAASLIAAAALVVASALVFRSDQAWANSQ